MGILGVWQRVGAEVRGKEKTGDKAPGSSAQLPSEQHQVYLWDVIRLLLKIHLKKEFQGLTNEKRKPLFCHI